MSAALMAFACVTLVLAICGYAVAEDYKAEGKEWHANFAKKLVLFCAALTLILAYLSGRYA